MTATVRFLPWDSDFFGRRIARIELSAGSNEIDEALDECTKLQIDCAYCIVGADRVSSVRALEDNGFHQVDQRLTLTRSLSDPSPKNETSSSLVRTAQAEDIPALEAIARVSHGDSRFYADGSFARDRCDDLYAAWIAKSCTGYAERVFTEGDVGRPSGYVTCDVKDGVGSVGLVAVASQAQGTGVGRRLLGAGVAWFCERGVQEVEVVTQGRNIRAQRLYQSLGFRTKALDLSYHKWFDGLAHQKKTK